MDEKEFNPLDNLKPWPKGVSGNPAGKPKGIKNRTTIVKELLEGLHESGKTNIEVATAAVIKKAMAGDVTAWEKLLDSGYGKVTDKVETTHTFKEMGKIIVGGDQDQAKALSFDIGEDPSLIEGEVIRDDQA